MLRTRVGSAGGTTPDPTYRNIGDHTEVFQVDYDPAVVTFDELLDVFWDNHEPCASAWSSQYRAILFYQGDTQRRAAEASRDRVAAELGRPVQTVLVELRRFYLAEDYHQKYALRRHRALTEDLMKLFPEPGALVDSTAAARINAHLDGDLSYRELRAELERLGLQAVGEQRLEGIERL